MAAFGESVYTPSFYEQYRDIIIASGDGATEQDYRNFLVSLNAIMHFDVQKEVRKITCPVFVLGAGDDRVLGAQAAADLAEALRCPYYIYEGYGHGVYDEAPDYLSRIAAFLKGE
jgi:pimeloyl-ACP methyl ester carboxylesterase